MSQEERTHTTRRLAGHTLWNLAGFCLPMLAALVAVPILDHGLALGPFRMPGLGREKLYVLGLVWMFVGYFSIFDMGLGRALTKLVAERLSLGKKSELPGLFWTATAAMFLLGVAAMLIMAGLTPRLAGSWLKIADGLRDQSRQAFYIAALGMPIVVMTIGLIGVLEACHRFRLINAIRIPMGTFTFIGPLLVLSFTTDLAWVVGVLILGRVVECAGYGIACLRVLPELRAAIRLEKKEFRPLIGFGGWMTISNLTVPAMIHVNRLLIGIIRTAAEGTFYLVPEEVVVRILILPRAWISALFPAFVDELSTPGKDPSELFGRGIKYLLLAVFPVSLAVVTLAPEGLRIWMGDEFAVQSAFVMQCLTIGIFFHCMARVPWFFVQAAGRPDLSAVAHLVQLPLYIGLAWLLIGRYGIAGAAMAWSLRMGLDMVLMFIFARDFLPRGLASIRPALAGVAVAATLLLVCLPVGPLSGRLGGGLAALVFFIIIAWKFVLTQVERSGLVKEIQRYAGRSLFPGM